MCHGLKLNHALGKQQLELSIHSDQVMHLETMANLSASQPDVKKPLKSGNVSH